MPIKEGPGPQELSAEEQLRRLREENERLQKQLGGEREEFLAERKRQQFVQEMLGGAAAQALNEEEAIQEQAARREKELMAMAYEDALTGIPSRRALEEYLVQNVARVQPPGVPESRREGVLHHLTLVLADADNFKRINDELGHEAGDEALKAIANFLSHDLDARASDAVGRMTGRYGGEEFLMVFPGATEEEILKKLKEKSKDKEGLLEITFNYRGKEYSVTLSLGIASFIPGEDKDGKSALVRADKALYQAKEKGRKQIVVYDESMATLHPPTRSGEKPPEEGGKEDGVE